MKTIKASEIKEDIPKGATHYNIGCFYKKPFKSWMVHAGDWVESESQHNLSFESSILEIIYDTDKPYVPDVGEECELAMEETEFLSLQRGEVTTKPAGTRVKVVGHINRIDNNNLCITIMCVDDPSCGFCTGNPEYLVRPIKSEEDKLRDWLKGQQPTTDRSDIKAKLNQYTYNLIKAGVKIPEGEQ